MRGPTLHFVQAAWFAGARIQSKSATPAIRCKAGRRVQKRATRSDLGDAFQPRKRVPTWETAGRLGKTLRVCVFLISRGALYQALRGCYGFATQLQRAPIRQLVRGAGGRAQLHGGQLFSELQATITKSLATKSCLPRHLAGNLVWRASSLPLPSRFEMRCKPRDGIKSPPARA